VIQSCVIRDNGFAENGYGIEIRGLTHDVEIRDNQIEDSGEGKQKVGIQIEREARGTVMEGNTFINMESEVQEEGVEAVVAD
jgi:nitrous oxidase accessory protein NosD